MDVVLSLNWNSAYQSARGLVLHLGAAWRGMGLELVEIDISDADWVAELKRVLDTRQVRLVLCTAGVGANVRVDNDDLWARLRLPVFSLLFDHPAYLAANHRTQGKGVVLGYMFRDHALYQASDVRAENMVTSIDFGVPDLPVHPIAALAASWRAVPQLERVLHDVIDGIALERRGLANVAAFPKLVREAAAANRLELQPFDLASRWLIAQVDDYIRRLKSTAIARALLRFEVDVFGRAWEHIDTTGARARFHGPVDYATVEAQFPDATASLTMNPNIDLSAHDRFFTALGAGIMPVSDRNTYIGAMFPEVLPYTFDFTPGSIERALERVMRFPDMALETARAVRARTRPVAGVEVAARQILEAAQSVAFLHFADKPAQDFFVA